MGKINLENGIVLDFGTSSSHPEAYESLLWQAIDKQGREIFRVGGDIVLDSDTDGTSHQELVVQDYKNSKLDWRKNYHPK